MLVNWYYPDNIYPMNLEDHANIQKSITEKLPLVKYTDNGFDYEELVKFLDDTKAEIMKKYNQFYTEDTTLKTYYMN